MTSRHRPMPIFSSFGVYLPQNFLQIPAGVAPRIRGDLLGRAGGHDPAAQISAFGAQVDDMVGGLDNVKVVFDHHHRIAARHQTLEHFQQAMDIREVETGGGFVQDVEGFAGGTFAQLTGEFDPLGFASR